MAFLILIAFLTVPIAEIAVFIHVGGQIGLWPTVGVVILTAVLGTALLRQQGLSVLFRIRENLAANRLPIGEVFDGVCLVFAGLLLLTPGFITDAVGFALMVPPLRRLLAAHLARRFLDGAEIKTHSPAPSEDGTVIDGEYRDITPGAGPSAGPTAEPGSNPTARPTKRIDG